MSNPTLLVAQLDNSLAYTDQAGAGTLTGVEPILYDDGLWLRQGATNRITNPSIEVDTTGWAGGWAGGAGTVISRITTDPYVGVGALQAVFTAVVDGGIETSPMAATPGETVTASCFARRNDGPGSLYVILIELTGAFGFVAADIGPVTPIGTDYTELSFTKELEATTEIVYMGVRTPSYTGTMVLDGFMLTDADTDYFDGDTNGGVGFDWASTPHASASTRAASSASVATAEHIASDRGGVILKKYRRKLDTGGVEPIIDIGDGTTGEDRLRVRINASDKLEMSWQTNGAAETTIQSVASIAVDTDYFIYVGWNGIHVELSIDNGTKVTGTRDAPAGAWGTAPMTLKAA